MPCRRFRGSCTGSSARDRSSDGVKMLAAKVSLAPLSANPFSLQKYKIIGEEVDKRPDLGLEEHPFKWLSVETSVLAKKRGVSMEQFWVTRPKKVKTTEASVLAKNSNSSTFWKQSQHSLLHWLNSLDSAVLPAQHLETSSYFKESGTTFLFYLSLLYIFVKCNHQIHCTEDLNHLLLSVQWIYGHNVSSLLSSAVTAGKVMLIISHHCSTQWDYIKGNHNKRDNPLLPNPLQRD